MAFTLLKRLRYLISEEQIYNLIQLLLHLQWDKINPMTVITTNSRLVNKSISLSPNTLCCNSLKHHHLCFGTEAPRSDKASASSTSSKFIKGGTTTVIRSIIIIPKLPFKSSKEAVKMKTRTALLRKGKKILSDSLKWMGNRWPLWGTHRAGRALQAGTEIYRFCTTTSHSVEQSITKQFKSIYCIAVITLLLFTAIRFEIHNQLAIPFWLYPAYFLRQICAKKPKQCQRCISSFGLYVSTEQRGKKCSKRIMLFLIS